MNILTTLKIAGAVIIATASVLAGILHYWWVTNLPNQILFDPYWDIFWIGFYVVIFIASIKYAVNVT